MTEMPKRALANTLRGLLWIIVIAGVVAVVLAVANWLPSLAHRDFARKYGSIEEAKRSLGLERVAVPAYFPAGISWPPSLVLAQKSPFEAVVMEFRKPETEETALIVIQCSAHASCAQFERIRMSEVKEETEYRLKGRVALLQVGMCNNVSCSRISWQDLDHHFTVVLMSSPFEIIRIAESMIH